MNRRFWTEGWGSIGLAVLAALVVRWALMEAYVIPSGSMLPSLLVNDHIFVNKIVYGVRAPFTEKWLVQFMEPKRGEVVVFKNPQHKADYYVKRIVGLPGDRVFYENGNLYVNEKLVDKTVPQLRKTDFIWLRDEDFLGRDSGLQDYVHWEENLDQHFYSVLLRKGDRTQLAFGPYLVPDGHYFVMGDNRDNSVDSRLWDPRSSRASGQVVFRRQSAIGEVVIPEGSVVTTRDQDWRIQKFRTTEDVSLRGESVTVQVRAVEPGLSGNIAAGAIEILETPVAGAELQVSNPQSFSGGEDKRFVPRDYLVGRGMFIWLSCEEKLPLLSFLCNPAAIRWSRFFHAVN